MSFNFAARKGSVQTDPGHHQLLYPYTFFDQHSLFVESPFNFDVIIRRNVDPLHEIRFNTSMMVLSS